jgi:hypothetical protein
MAACIISTAQHANPKVRGHSDPPRAQEIIEINFDDIHSNFKLCYLGTKGALLSFYMFWKI